MRGSGVWITASNLSLLLCPKNEGWSGYRVRRHNMGVIQAPNCVAEKAPAVTTGLLLCPRSGETNTSGGFCFSVLMKASLRTVGASLRLSHRQADEMQNGGQPRGAARARRLGRT